MNEQQVIKLALSLCDNGTRSCKVYDITDVYPLTQDELINILRKASIRCRISKNVNHIPLLVIDRQ